MKRAFLPVLLIASTLVFWSCVFSSAALADGEFSVAYDVTYKVLETGKTEVTTKATLSNLTASYYVTEYTLIISSTEISDVEASDSQGPILDKVIKGEDTTNIHLVFNDKVAGKGNKLNFELKYIAGDIATKNGLIWEINTPRLVPEIEIAQYNLTLAVPASFRSPLYMIPKPIKQEGVDNFQFFFFEKEQIEKQGVSAAFGKFQVLSFNLSYHLSNPNLFPVVTKIAFPPDTSYQTVVLTEVYPKPVNVAVDEDGNWLASYTLGANEKVDIEATGFVKIFAKPKTALLKLSSWQREVYTQPQKFWESESEEVKTAASHLSTPRQVYDFVVKTLKYDPKRFEGGGRRAGASLALANPSSAICMEFTDLFIALCRAIGIPARELNGFAYTVDEKRRPLGLGRAGSDVLHAWAEYYDEEKGWVPVDPTWGTTTQGMDFFEKLDLNHFVFVTHGMDSEKPYPAGAYKTDILETGDVKVDFAKTEPETILEPEVSFDFPTAVISDLPFSGTITVSQKGNTAYPPAELFIESDFFEVEKNQKNNLRLIPPFGKIDLEVSLKSPKVATSEFKTVVVKYDGQSFTTEILVKPFLISLFPTLGVVGGGLASGIVLFIFARKMRRLSL